jgi:hypothetical protein
MSNRCFFFLLTLLATSGAWAFLAPGADGHPLFDKMAIQGKWGRSGGFQSQGPATPLRPEYRGQGRL